MHAAAASQKANDVLQRLQAEAERVRGRTAALREKQGMLQVHACAQALVLQRRGFFIINVHGPGPSCTLLCAARLHYI